MLPLLPPSWFAGLSVRIHSGKLFPMISFSLMAPVSGRFLGWFPLPGLLSIPPAYGVWYSANLLGPSSQGHLFVGSLSLQELNCRGIHREVCCSIDFYIFTGRQPIPVKMSSKFLMFAKGEVHNIFTIPRA